MASQSDWNKVKWVYHHPNGSICVDCFEQHWNEYFAHQYATGMRMLPAIYTQGDLKLDLQAFRVAVVKAWAVREVAE